MQSTMTYSAAVITPMSRVGGLRPRPTHRVRLAITGAVPVTSVAAGSQPVAFRRMQASESMPLRPTTFKTEGKMWQCKNRIPCAKAATFSSQGLNRRERSIHSLFKATRPHRPFGGNIKSRPTLSAYAKTRSSESITHLNCASILESVALLISKPRTEHRAASISCVSFC